MIHITCGLTAKNRDQLQNPTLGNRVWATFTFRFHLEFIMEEKIHLKETVIKAYKASSVQYMLISMCSRELSTSAE